jgi:YVTN family beta-propeller protein
MKFSRRTYVVFFLILTTGLCLRGQKPKSFYRPSIAAQSAPAGLPPLPKPYDDPYLPDLPPLPDPFPNDPPDPFDNPFDPVNDLPDPFDSPFPPEDPLLPPLPDPFEDPGLPELPLPDPFDEPSLFPEPFDDLPDPFDDLPPLPELPVPGEVAAVALPRDGGMPGAASGATNVPTPLMPFPMRLPFPPTYMGVSAPRTTPVCNPVMSETLVVAGATNNTVDFVSVCPPTLTASVKVGLQPTAAKATPDRTQVWVTNSGSASISIVSVASKTVVGTINLPPLNGAFPAVPNNIAFLPDGSLAYVTDHDDQNGSTVYVIDVATQAVIQQIGVGNFPASIGVSPDGSQVWIPCRADNNVYVIDTLTNTVITAIPNISLPTGITFNPTGTLVYVAEGNPVGGVVDVIDPGTFTVLNTIPVGDLPHVVKMSPTGHHLFVTNLGSNSISVINPANDAVLYNLTFPDGAVHPLGIAFIH